MRHVVLVVALGGCGPSAGRDTSNGGSGSGDSGSTGTSSPSSEVGTTPLDDGGCPSDLEASAEVPRGEARQNLDEDTLDDDPRFEDEFCESRCPPPPAAGYELLFCEPRNDADVLPAGTTTDPDGGTTTESSSGGGSEGSTGEPGGTETGATETGGTETGATETGATETGATETGLPGDDVSIEIRCYYWPRCM